jgi:serine/threonine kinase PknH
VRDRNRWSLLAIALVACAAVGAVGPGCSAPIRTTAPPPGAPADLTSILLSADQINAIMGASAMAPGAAGTAMVNPTFTLSNPDCSATLTVAEGPVYTGSGFTAVLEQRLQEPGDARQHLVGQAAATFPSADQAGAFVKSSAAKWKSCTGQPVTQTDPGKTVRWTVGDLTGTDTRIVQPHTRAEPADGWHCQHVLSAVTNVVVDVDACGYRVTDEGRQIADKMAANTNK